MRVGNDSCDKQPHCKIVHPDEVVKYVHPDECRLSNNPLLMALLWESLATRETKLLEHCMRHRERLRYGCTWVNYLHCFLDKIADLTTDAGPTDN